MNPQRARKAPGALSKSFTPSRGRLAPAARLDACRGRKHLRQVSSRRRERRRGANVSQRLCRREPLTAKPRREPSASRRTTQLANPFTHRLGRFMSVLRSPASGRSPKDSSSMGSRPRRPRRHRRLPPSPVAGRNGQRVGTARRLARWTATTPSSQSNGQLSYVVRDGALFCRPRFRRSWRLQPDRIGDKSPTTRAIDLAIDSCVRSAGARRNVAAKRPTVARDHRRPRQLRSRRRRRHHQGRKAASPTANVTLSGMKPLQSSASDVRASTVGLQQPAKRRRRLDSPAPRSLSLRLIGADRRRSAGFDRISLLPRHQQLKRHRSGSPLKASAL